MATFNAERFLADQFTGLGNAVMAARVGHGESFFRRIKWHGAEVGEVSDRDDVWHPNDFARCEPSTKPAVVLTDADAVLRAEMLT